MLPLSKVGYTSELLVRVENLFDNFDGYLEARNVSFDKLLANLYQRANPHWDGKVPNFSIVQVALGNN